MFYEETICVLQVSCIDMFAVAAANATALYSCICVFRSERLLWCRLQRWCEMHYAKESLCVACRIEPVLLQ